MNLDIVYRKGVSISNIFSLDDVNEPAETIRCRFQVLYFILQEELMMIKEKKQRYIDSEEQRKLRFDGTYEQPSIESDHMMNTIHHRYVRVLQL